MQYHPMTRAYDPLKRRARNLKRYGITEAQFQAMWERQHGLCDICTKPLPARPHVDHDHRTGRVRGLLDWWCNRLLGTHRNTPMMFRNAARYLESSFDARTFLFVRKDSSDGGGKDVHKPVNTL
jgi:Recombination endonuclease VII